MANTWQTVGILLGVAAFAVIVAVLTRLFSVNKIEGQTFSMVVLGVAGVVSIAGFSIWWETVVFLCMCFSDNDSALNQLDAIGKTLKDSK